MVDIVTRERLPVTMAGFVNVDRLPRYYCTADTLAHPSELDQHPLVCSEAPAVGLPMILSDAVGAIGPTDVARIGENAICYPCGDVASLARAILQISGDAALHRQMSAASMRIYDDCNMAASIAGITGALRMVTADKPRFKHAA